MYKEEHRDKKTVIIIHYLGRSGCIHLPGGDDNERPGLVNVDSQPLSPATARTDNGEGATQEDRLKASISKWHSGLMV